MSDTTQARAPEPATMIDTLIGIVTDKLAALRERGQAGEESFYKARLALAFLLGLRNGAVRL